jgi:hypothetical protein
LYLVERSVFGVDATGAAVLDEVALAPRRARWSIASRRRSISADVGDTIDELIRVRALRSAETGNLHRRSSR